MNALDAMVDERERLAGSLPGLEADQKRKENVAARHDRVSMAAYDRVKECKERIAQLDEAIAVMERPVGRT